MSRTKKMKPYTQDKIHDALAKEGISNYFLYNGYPGPDGKQRTPNYGWYLYLPIAREEVPTTGEQAHSGPGNHIFLGKNAIVAKQTIKRLPSIMSDLEKKRVMQEANVALERVKAMFPSVPFEKLVFEEDYFTINVGDNSYDLTQDHVDVELALTFIAQYIIRARSMKDEDKSN